MALASRTQILWSCFCLFSIDIDKTYPISQDVFFFCPTRWVTKAFHPFAAAPTPLSNFGTYCGQSKCLPSAALTGSLLSLVLRVRLCVCAALSDDVLVDAVFLPDTQPTLHEHDNTWLSILSHGAFSSHAPPPSPGPSLSHKHTHTLIHAHTS